MRRISPRELLIVLLLICCGVTLRMAFLDIPNFAPVAALALLAGYLLRSRLAAVAVPLGVMMVSDSMIGSDRPAITLAVYASLAIPALIGQPLRRWNPIRSLGSLNTWKSMGWLGGAAFGSSCLFFLVSNLACWRFSGWYDLSWQGLSSCFIAAVPFFRFTLAGDLSFTLGFFALYAAGQSLARYGTLNERLKAEGGRLKVEGVI